MIETLDLKWVDKSLIDENVLLDYQFWILSDGNICMDSILLINVLSNPHMDKYKTQE